MIATNSTPFGAVELDQPFSGNPRQADPSSSVPGSPPNFGEGLLPHVISFQGIVSSVARVYRPSDEAIKHSFDNAKFMRNDIAIMECVEQRQRALALLDWHLEPEDPKDSRQRDLVEQVKSIIEAIPRFMQYRENLSHATWYGKYGVQHRWRWKNIKGKMRVCVDRWLPVHGDKLVFRYDDGTQTYDPDQVGIRVGAGFTTGDTVAKRWSVERLNKVEPTDYGLAYFLEPWERALLAIHKHYIEDGEYEDPTNAGRIHGVGTRSRIYWTWFQKQEALAFLMEYLERCAAGIEIWYYPMGNPDAEEKVRKAAQERIGQGRNVVMVPRPPGDDAMLYDYQRVEPGMQGAEVVKDIVERYFGHLIKRYILGQVLTSEAEPTGMGSEVAGIHFGTFMQIVRYDALLHDETITTDLIDPIIRFNRPDMAGCRVRFVTDTEADNTEEKLGAWKSAFEMGLELKTEDVRQLIGAGKPDQDDETLSMAQQQQQQQDMQMQAQAAMGGQPGANGSGTSVHSMPSGGDADEVWKALEANRLKEALGMPVEPYAKFDESKHPRAADGKFGSGGHAKSGGSKPSGNPKVQAWAEKRFKDPEHAKAFVKWFGDSKVVDEDGEPLTVYHGTTGEFDEFNGVSYFATDADYAKAHIRTPLKPVPKQMDEPIPLSDAAKNELITEWGFTSEDIADVETQGANSKIWKEVIQTELSQPNATTRELEAKYLTTPARPKVIQSFLQINNPADFSEIPHDKELTDKQFKAFMQGKGLDTGYFATGKTGTIADHLDWNREEVASAAQEAGFDGIIQNEFESTGLVDKVFITFEPTQIKSATGNRGTFDPDNPKINYTADAPGPEDSDRTKLTDENNPGDVVRKDTEGPTAATRPREDLVSAMQVGNAENVGTIAGQTVDPERWGGDGASLTDLLRAEFSGRGW